MKGEETMGVEVGKCERPTVRCERCDGPADIREYVNGTIYCDHCILAEADLPARTDRTNGYWDIFRETEEGLERISATADRFDASLTVVKLRANGDKVVVR